jgi:Ca2+-binding EF-hand superfamily protein
MGNKMSENYTPDDLVLAFSAFDKDGNGQIGVAGIFWIIESRDCSGRTSIRAVLFGRQVGRYSSGYHAGIS